MIEKDVMEILMHGSQSQMNEAIGNIARNILFNDLRLSKEDLWWVIGSVLTRKDSIPSNNHSRISLLSICNSVNDWRVNEFKFIVDLFNSFLISSLTYGDDLIKEESLRFICDKADSYGKAFHLPNHVKELETLGRNIIESIEDDLLKEDYNQGFNRFLRNAYEWGEV